MKAAIRGRYDSLEQEVFLNLWRAYDCLKELEEAVFDRFGLTAQRYNVLRLLRAVHPNSMQTLALASRLVTRAPDITRMLDKLDERGLVMRERLAENRRVVRVSITSAGLALVKKIATPLRQCHEKQLGHMTPEQLEALSALLEEACRPHERSQHD